MKKIKIVLFTIAIVYTLMYLSMAFASWDLNPSKWSEEARSIVSILSLLMSIFFSLFALSFESRIKDDDELLR